MMSGSGRMRRRGRRPGCGRPWRTGRPWRAGGLERGGVSGDRRRCRQRRNCSIAGAATGQGEDRGGADEGGVPSPGRRHPAAAGQLVGGSGASEKPSMKHQPHGSPPDWFATTACWVAAKCAVACRRGEDSQQPVWPQTRHRRSSTHVVPSIRHSLHAASGSAAAGGTAIVCRCPQTTTRSARFVVPSLVPTVHELTPRRVDRGDRPNLLSIHSRSKTRRRGRRLPVRRVGAGGVALGGCCRIDLAYAGERTAGRFGIDEGTCLGAVMCAVLVAASWRTSRSGPAGWSSPVASTTSPSWWQRRSRQRPAGGGRAGPPAGIGCHGRCSALAARAGPPVR